jgi:hypothetical protein
MSDIPPTPPISSEADRASLCIYCAKSFPAKDFSEAEIKRVYDEAIKHDLECEKNPLVLKIHSLESRLSQSEAARVEAEENANRIAAYAKHYDDCQIIPCDCGLNKLRTQAALSSRAEAT